MNKEAENSTGRPETNLRPASRLADWAETARVRHTPRAAAAPSVGRCSAAGRAAGQLVLAAPARIGGSGEWALGTRRQIWWYIAGGGQSEWTCAARAGAGTAYMYYPNLTNGPCL
jgi:hypothetical protein